jgi:hypothetical protein
MGIAEARLTVLLRAHVRASAVPVDADRCGLDSV